MTKKNWIERYWPKLMPYEQVAVAQTVKYIRDLKTEKSLEDRVLYGKAFYLNMIGGISTLAESMLDELLTIDWQLEN